MMSPQPTKVTSCCCKLSYSEVRTQEAALVRLCVETPSLMFKGPMIIRFKDSFQLLRNSFLPTLDQVGLS